jgi:hypothetical protein
MSNKETLQSKNARLNNNNSSLNSILETINNLPDAGSINVPSEDLTSELNIQSSLLNTQGISITDIENLLVGKAVGDNTEIDGLIDGSISEYTNSRVTSIAKGAMQNKTYLKKLSFPNATIVNTDAFNNCTGLLEINIEKCTKLWTRAFRYCSGLTSLNLPVCLEIWDYSIANCTKLVTVDSIATKIYTNAFNGSSALTKLILRNTTMCVLDNVSAFNNTPIASGTGYVYVPDNLVDSYKSATNWSTYAAQIKPLSEL